MSWQRFVPRIFEQARATGDNACVVAKHLVDADLAGHDSHGVIRVAEDDRGESRFER